MNFLALDAFWVESFELETFLNRRYISRSLRINSIISGSTIKAERRCRLAGVLRKYKRNFLFGLTWNNAVLNMKKPYWSSWWRRLACLHHLGGSGTRVLDSWRRLGCPRIEWHQLPLHEPSSLTVRLHRYCYVIIWFPNGKYFWFKWRFFIYSCWRQLGVLLLFNFMLLKKKDHADRHWICGCVVVPLTLTLWHSIQDSMNNQKNSPLNYCLKKKSTLENYYFISI